jgi:hypothetical protein
MSTIIAREKFPITGIALYQAKLVGKSQKKSDKGPIKARTLLIAANNSFINTTPLVQRYPHAPFLSMLKKSAKRSFLFYFLITSQPM